MSSLEVRTGAKRAPLIRHDVALVRGLGYYMLAPDRVTPGAPLLVAVHGSARNAEALAGRFAATAARCGMVLVVPVFSAEHFPDYQSLGASGGGGRADLALQAMLAEVFAAFPHVWPRLLLFGHAGGSRFVHRYVMAWPEHVERYAADAPGSPVPPLTPDLAGFLRVPGCVMVSAPAMRGEPPPDKAAWMQRVRGIRRHMRGRRFVAAVNAQAGRMGLPPPLSFRAVPESGWVVSGLAGQNGIVEAAAGFLCGDLAVQPLADRVEARAST